MKADGQVSGLDPMVEWDFARLSQGVVADLAPGAPDIPLFLTANGSANAPVIEGNTLWLRQNFLASSPMAARALSDATAAAGGGLTVEFWLRGTIAEGQVFGLGSEGLSAFVRDEGLVAEVTTSNGLIDLAYPPSFSLGGNLHQLAFTYRPGLALMTGYFDGVDVTMAGDSVGNTTSKLVLFTEQSAALGSFFVGDDAGELRYASAAIFTRELTADEVRLRYNLGLSRL